MAPSKAFALVLIVLANGSFSAAASSGVDSVISCVTELCYQYVSTSKSVDELFQKCSDALVHIPDLQHSGIQDWIKAAKEEFKVRLRNHRKGAAKELVEQIVVPWIENMKHKVIENSSKKVREQYDAGFEETYTLFRPLKKYTLYLLMGIVSQEKTATKAVTSAVKIQQYSAFIGLGAEVAEYGITKMGYEKEGKIVGAIGNTISLAMTGFTVLGPGGAVAGAGLGLYLKWSE